VYFSSFHFDKKFPKSIKVVSCINHGAQLYVETAPSFLVQGWKAIQKMFHILVLGAMNRRRSSSADSIDSEVMQMGWRSSAFVPISERTDVDHCKDGRQIGTKQISGTVAQTGHQSEEIEDCATACNII
jgi:hypothetical protein